MLPLFQEQFANAGSVTHEFGRSVAQIVDTAIADIASAIGATADELVITSGATESNNLALFGACLHPRQKRRKIVSVVTEHKALLDPLDRLEKQGFECKRLAVAKQDTDSPGQVDLQQMADAIDEHTALVSVMLANNEIGVIQPIAEIAEFCRQHGALLHCDATQAVGRMPVEVDRLGVDLLSFSAHKFYGPKGVGGLFVRRRERRVRLQAQIVGGGQQNSFRSGTLNTAGTVGMQAALRSCLENMEADSARIAQLRDRLFEILVSQLDRITLNGPALDARSNVDTARLPGNLNCCFYPIEGQSLMLAMPELAVSSGSACTSAEASPSHVLLALGLTVEQARSSLRFGLGRYNTLEEVERAAALVVQAVRSLENLI